MLGLQQTAPGERTCGVSATCRNSDFPQRGSESIDGARGGAPVTLAGEADGAGLQLRKW